VSACCLQCIKVQFCYLLHLVLSMIGGCHIVTP
jgi:hypothetical protein